MIEKLVREDNNLIRENDTNIGNSRQINMVLIDRLNEVIERLNEIKNDKYRKG